ncbi:MAG TPA: aspartyl protease family protein [Candidatus Binatia bacterium]|nr:aspartyl protease family protein [Candidatus Binatia bacterium]
MGMTYVVATVRAAGAGDEEQRVRLIVDSGAIYSVLPQGVWQSLGLTPSATEEFVLADGTTIRRGISECRFELLGRSATSPVILGEAGDEAILGAVTLETLRLMLHPLTRELLPARLSLAQLA